ncbi:MAG: hypothetical protein SFV81_24715 [Pirellulaceae bacterium]|nr:hypothetical protein [Pirellulaceae bacterium]
MWKNTTILFTVLGILSLIVTEIIRSVVDRKRVERDGLGGTQDIAIGGIIASGLCAIGAIICGLGWLIQYFNG